MSESNEWLSSPITLLEMVNRSKSGEMDYLLGVLQPEQYELATFPSDRNLVIDGSPGSGKTVIAVHRAGFLTHAERDHGPRERLLLVGPSQRWVKHISRVSSAIAMGDVAILSIAELEMKLAGAKTCDESSVNIDSEPWPLQSAELWSLIQQSTRVLQVSGAFQKHGTKPREMSKGEKRKAVFSKLKKKDSLIAHLCNDLQVWNWLSGLPPQKESTDDPKLNSLFAAIGQSIEKDLSLRFDHLIVDEAQEISHLQWQLLHSCLNRNGVMTIFGDMNQQFIKTGFHDWGEIFHYLELGDPVIRNNRTVFRSTRQIVEFANRFALNPVHDFKFLREGPEPTVIHCHRNAANQEVLQIAHSIVSEGTHHTCAVFSVDPVSIEDALRSNGWIKGRNEAELNRDELRMSVLRTREARGLEFDVVVAVDTNSIACEGGLGQLYTCLTRAAHCLYVIEPFSE